MRVTRHAYEVDDWGVGELWAAEGMVVAHDAPSPLRAGTAPTATTTTFVTDVLARIHGFFAGEHTALADLPLDLGGCTPFQLDVAGALRRVPWGEVVAYGELAALAGYPRAGRAVGTFCAQNRYFLFLPCHRVVGASGIGSYGSLGIPYKRRLLQLEGNAAL
jgi:methylated-DNA-[protein]-cysteine S-methyltransferase